MPIMGFQPQIPRSQTRPRGPSGEPQDRQASHSTSAHSERLSSSSRSDNFAYYFATENDGYHNNQQTPIYAPEISPEDLGSSRNYREGFEGNAHYRKVGRSQKHINPAVLQVLKDTRLKGLDRPPVRGSNGYSQPHARLSQPTHARPYLQEYDDYSRSVNPSDLQKLDHTRGTFNMDRRRYLPEREEPYHNVGYVGWKSDDERR